VDYSASTVSKDGKDVGEDDDDEAHDDQNMASASNNRLSHLVTSSQRQQQLRQLRSEISVRLIQRYADTLQRTRSALNINFISSRRSGKKLLVLDLDFTLFDMHSSSSNFLSLKRPFTDEFLTAVYPFYDIIIWSQTSWRWLEIKLTELGMLTNVNYRIMFVLDKTCMFSVEADSAASSSSSTRVHTHHVKPLAILWQHSQLAGFNYGPHDTVHVDDLARNFALNPQSGLKIKAYKHSSVNRARDTELVPLARYLSAIAMRVSDFSTLNHRAWKRYPTAD